MLWKAIPGQIIHAYQVGTNMDSRLGRACNKRLPLGHVRAF